MQVKFNAGIYCNKYGESVGNKNRNGYSNDILKSAMPKGFKMPVFDHKYCEVGKVEIQEVDDNFNITGDIEFDTRSIALASTIPVLEAMINGTAMVQLRGMYSDGKFEAFSIGIKGNE